MASQAENAAALQKVADQLDKISGESSGLLAAIADLKAQAASEGASVSPELQAAIDNVASKAQAIDDLVPDAPTP